jgi:hypothetical protein
LLVSMFVAQIYVNICMLMWFKYRMLLVVQDAVVGTLSNIIYSQICPNGHLHSMVICVMRPLCFCPSAARSLLKQSVLFSH